MSQSAMGTVRGVLPKADDIKAMCRHTKVWRKLGVWVAQMAVGSALVCIPNVGRAEGGEVAIEFLSGHEVAFVKHPNLLASPKSRPGLYVPRLALHAVYGVTQRLNAGLGLEATLPRTVVTYHAAYQKTEDGDLTATYSGIDVPFLLEYWHFTGTDWSWSVGLAAGLSQVHWADLSLDEPGAGERSFPLDPLSGWTSMLFGRASAGFVWRPGDHLALRGGVSLALKHQGDIHAGIWIAADLHAGAGPSLW